MNVVLSNFPIFVKGGKTLEIDLKNNFCILHSMITLNPTKAKGYVRFKITNTKNNSMEITASVIANSLFQLAFKPYNGLFDSSKEDFHTIEITPENDLEGYFSWSKDCGKELIAKNAR